MCRFSVKADSSLKFLKMWEMEMKMEGKKITWNFYRLFFANEMFKTGNWSSRGAWVRLRR